jgi:steroid delta-isomerase-like uncharacterized protein
MPDQENTLEALVRRWFEEVWNKGNGEVIDELLGADCVVYGITDASGNPVTGPLGFKPFFQQFRSAFPDINVSIEDILSKGDKVAARCRVRATHTGHDLGIEATQKPIDFTGMCIVRVENGKVVEAWNNFDFMAMYQQIGLM